jgi:hypothetical protein
MNTQEELRIAFEEYEKGTFIKYKEVTGRAEAPPFGWVEGTI